MADITRVNGNAKAHGSPAGAITADELVILNDMDMDYFKIIVTNGSAEVVDITNELDVIEAVSAILSTIGTKANVEMYQVEGDATGQISVAVKGKDAWTTTTLQAAIRAMGGAVGANSVDVSGSTVTSSGLEFV